MPRLRPTSKQLLAALTIGCLFGTGLLVPGAPTAEACSPGYSFRFEHFLEAETLDDLHDPEGPYAQSWAAASSGSDDPEPITGVSLVFTVAEIEADIVEERGFRIFGGVTTLRHRWGDASSAENPLSITLRPSAYSCNFMNFLPEHGADTWYLNNTRNSDWRSFTDVPTPDLIAALTRLFGEPTSPERDLAREGEIITELTQQLEERGEMLVQPIEPAMWLNPATGEVQPWDANAAAETPSPTFTG